MLDRALEVQGKARRRMVQLDQKFPQIARLDTVPGLGRIGAHRVVGYLQEPTRFQDRATALPLLPAGPP